MRRVDRAADFDRRTHSQYPAAYRGRSRLSPDGRVLLEIIHPQSAPSRGFSSRAIGGVRCCICSSATARCSATIRKCWKEAPAPNLSRKCAAAFMTRRCCSAAPSIMILAGTVEFIMEAGDDNAIFSGNEQRLQVETPSPNSSRIDLVEWQLLAAPAKRPAAGAERHPHPWPCHRGADHRRSAPTIIPAATGRLTEVRPHPGAALRPGRGKRARRSASIMTRCWRS